MCQWIRFQYACGDQLTSRIQYCSRRYEHQPECEMAPYLVETRSYPEFCPDCRRRGGLDILPSPPGPNIPARQTTPGKKRSYQEPYDDAQPWSPVTSSRNLVSQKRSPTRDPNFARPSKRSKISNDQYSPGAPPFNARLNEIGEIPVTDPEVLRAVQNMPKASGQIIRRKPVGGWKASTKPKGLVLNLNSRPEAADYNFSQGAESPFDPSAQQGASQDRRSPCGAGQNFPVSPSSPPGGIGRYPTQRLRDRSATIRHITWRGRVSPRRSPTGPIRHESHFRENLDEGMYPPEYQSGDGWYQQGQQNHSGYQPPQHYQRQPPLSLGQDPEYDEKYRIVEYEISTGNHTVYQLRRWGDFQTLYPQHQERLLHDYREVLAQAATRQRDMNLGPDSPNAIRERERLAPTSWMRKIVNWWERQF